MKLCYLHLKLRLILGILLLFGLGIYRVGAVLLAIISDGKLWEQGLCTLCLAIC